MNTGNTKFGALQIGIILLAVATAVIHIVLAIPENLVMFYLNGAGYLGLTAALFLPQFEVMRGKVRWVLLGFTAVTVIGWVAIGARTPVAYIDKVIELALIALLWVEGRQK